MPEGKIIGLGGCFIGSAWDASNNPYGQEILKKWQVNTNYYAAVHVLLGYPEDVKNPSARARKNGRVIMA